MFEDSFTASVRMYDHAVTGHSCAENGYLYSAL